MSFKNFVTSPAFEHRVFMALMVAVSLAFVWILLPFGGAVFWGAVIAIVFTPVFARLQRRWPQRPTLAAMATLSLVLVIVVVPLTLLAGMLLKEGAALYQRVQSGETNFARYFEQVVAVAPAWLHDLLEHFGLTDFNELQTRISAALGRGSQLIASQVYNAGQNALDMVVGFFVMLYLAFFLLRDGAALSQRIRAAVPLAPEHRRHLTSKFITVIRATVKGNVLVAAAQGALGGLAFWFFGIKGALLWAVVMGFLSLLPAIGAGLIWLPVALYFLVTGATWQGVALIAYGVLVIGLVDNLLRPVLVGKDTQMPDYLVLISTIGGMAVFGINGFVIGPAIAAMFMAVWDLFTTAREAAAAQPPADPPAPGSPAVAGYSADMTRQVAPSRLAGHRLVEALIAHDVDTAFGVPGESFLAVLDGFHEYADKIRFVACRQEGGAAFMAEAQGKLTGRPGICFVTRGPGATNASIGLHTAFQDSTPMILFIGQVASDQRDREAFQEVDYRQMFGPGTLGMAKWVGEVHDAERLPEYVARAFHTAMQGRPGPVVLVLPEDMLTKPVAVPIVAPARPAEAAPTPAALAELRERLAAAKQPLVIAGGGGWTPEATAALQRFAEAWQLPVGCAFRFQDLFDNAHPNYAGDVGIGINPKLAARVKAADLILAVGPRLGEMTTGGYTLLQAPRPAQQLIHIHAGAEELGRVYTGELLINASMSQAAPALASLAQPSGIVWRDWTAAANADYRANLVPTPVAPLDMAEVIRLLDEKLPEGTIFTNGAGNYSGWLHRFHRYTGLHRFGKTQLAPTSGAMGYGVPAAVAAALLQQDRWVVNIAGDGDFLMTGQELATATGYGAKKLLVVVVDNGTYGTIRMHQEREYPGRVSGSDLFNPDFALLAEAFGFAAFKAERTEEVGPALDAAIAADRPALIHLRLSSDVSNSRSTLTAIREAAKKAQHA